MKKDDKDYIISGIIMFSILIVGTVIMLYFINKADATTINYTEVTVKVDEFPERTISISHEFNVTATVKQSDCRTCLEFLMPSDCLVSCRDIVIKN